MPEFTEKELKVFQAQKEIARELKNGSFKITCVVHNQEIVYATELVKEREKKLC